jgi:uncharacterized membrane protein
MFYNSLKIFHIISATLMLTSLGYCYHLWGRTKRSTELAIAASKIQTQTWLIILPVVILQLATGFSMISLKHEDFSQTWIIGSVIGFIVVIGSWFSFVYVLALSQQLLAESLDTNTAKFKTFRRTQSIILFVCATALFTMIFLMANKIQ